MDPCPKCSSTRRSEKTGRCLDCAKALTAAWRKANPGRQNAGVAAWHKANPDRVKAHKASWYRANAELTKTRATEWRLAHLEWDRARSIRSRRTHPESVKSAIAAWGKANPVKRRTYSIRYRARKSGATGTHTAKQWLNLLTSYHGRCIYCGGKATTRDHVTALDDGGTNDIENIAPACKPCNSSKGTKPLLVWMLTRYTRTEQEKK